MEHNGKSLFYCVRCLICTCRQLPPHGNFHIGEDYTFESIIDAREVIDSVGEAITFPENVFLTYFDNLREAVTSFCSIDNTKYHIYLILCKTSCSLEEIKACAKVMNVNYLQARRILIQKRNLLAVGSAFEMREILDKLSLFHVRYEIEPEYPYE